MFELSAPYSQEKNRIAKRKSPTLIERVKCIIIGREISNEHWPKIFQAIIYISNLLLTLSLNGIFSFEVSVQNLPILQHLRILGLTV